MYSIGIYDYRQCNSKVNKVNLLQAAIFLSSPRHQTERIYIKFHGDDGTRYITYAMLKKKIEEYLDHVKLEYHDLLEEVGKR